MTKHHKYVVREISVSGGNLDQMATKLIPVLRLQGNQHSDYDALCSVIHLFHKICIICGAKAQRWKSYRPCLGALSPVLERSRGYSVNRGFQFLATLHSFCGHTDTPSVLYLFIQIQGLTPGLGRSPGAGNDNHSSITAWEILRMEEPGGLHTVHRAPESEVTEQTHTHSVSKRERKKQHFAYF